MSEEVLILDRSGDDPKWIIATVSVSSDVRAAEMEPGGRRYAGWPDVAEWVRDRIGQRIRLVPVAAIVWRIYIWRAFSAAGRSQSSRRSPAARPVGDRAEHRGTPAPGNLAR